MTTGKDAKLERMKREISDLETKIQDKNDKIADVQCDIEELRDYIRSQKVRHIHGENGRLCSNRAAQ